MPLYPINIPVQLEHSELPPIIQFGFPIPKGVAQSKCQLSIFDSATNSELESNIQITSKWHDGSIKTCVLTVSLAQANIETSKLFIVIEEKKRTLAPSITPHLVEELPGRIVFETQFIKFIYESETSQFELKDKLKQVTQLGRLALKDSNGNFLKAKTNNYLSLKKTSLTTQDKYDLEIVVEGEFLNPNEETTCLFKQVFAFYQDGQLINIKCTLHNPKAAEHPNGLWDLGDSQSFHFTSLASDISLSQPQDIRVSLDKKQLLPPLTSALQITQYASGGENWQSPVHQDKDGNIPFIKNGFEVSQNQALIVSGSRASPILDISGMQLTYKHFWQNFPSGINLSKQKISIQWFPEIVGQNYELQGGEKKSQEVWVQLSSLSEQPMTWIDNSPNVNLPNDWLAQTHIENSLGFNKIPESWRSIVNNGLDSDSSFFIKRELLDEFGWRNFGDLYADHETAEYDGEGIFVSHYNNQYDPILGFLKQYILTGDRRWNELANDLASHVVDIDIYHTTQDKDEYNGGLFWHTDHYLQAYTSTHRSYSKHQPSNAYQDHAGGGGPGGQHCYTSGLALHHMLTGNEQSKQAVLTLANWITHVYEGSGTCLELLLAFKNRHIAGYKNHFTGQYPLDRGTANYVVALLDSYELTQDLQYLTRAEYIFKHSFHPNEDISLRDLDDVENTWFYTVLLQAICKYLAIKEGENQLDENFYYCRDSLLNFARWMAVNEYPYLEKPEILEYPNDTWTAQDLRKVHIFAAAYYYSPNNNHVFLEKAEFFENDILNRLNSSDTKTYTRIMVLVLQNYGYLNLYKSKTRSNAYQPVRFDWPSAPYQRKSHLTGLLRQMIRRLGKLSVKAELDWLKKRLN